MNEGTLPTADPASIAAIDVHDVTVAYRRKPVLWDVDVQFPAKRLIAIVGPNGAGKSTLLTGSETSMSHSTGLRW